MNKMKKDIERDIYDQHQNFYMYLAKYFLADLGIRSPSINQLLKFHWILSRTSVERFITIDSRLNQIEKTILYLSAYGKTIEGIAQFFNIGSRQVERYRSSILKKLHCSNIAEAVMKGIRFMEIPPINEFKEENHDSNR